MREYPDYPDEWLEDGHPQAEFWKTDPAYWQAHLDYSLDGYRETEKQRYAWLREWEKRPSPRGDMMYDVEYLRLRVTGECHRTGILSSLLTLHQLGHPEPTPRLT